MNLKTLLLMCVVGIASSSQVRSDTIDQIGSLTPFTPYTFAGLDATLSQFDIPRAAPLLQNFATSYDDFSFASNGFVTNLRWVGLYQDLPGPFAPFNPSFQVAFYENNVNQPGAMIGSVFNVGTANETLVTATGTGNGRYFSYSTAAPSFAVTAGTTYWVSIVANLDYDLQGWQLARSGIGTLASVQDFQEAGNPGLTRFFDASNYAIEITAVPEPGTFVTLALVGGVFFGRRRLVSKKN